MPRKKRPLFDTIEEDVATETQAVVRRLGPMLKSFGPGVITGAADDDPSGIATYSQTGAQFGYGQLWTAVFMFPFQTAVQEACARIGAVNGRGLAAVVREHYPRPILWTMVALVLIANTINIGADIGAMAAAAGLIVQLPFALLAIGFTVFMLALEILVSYPTYAHYLKWLCLALLAYPITAFIVHEPWDQVLRATFVPHIELSFAFLFIITGVLGTTISPYMFFWEASEEVEEEREESMVDPDAQITNAPKPQVSRGFLKGIVWDNVFGMFISEVATWSIIVVGATVLNTNGITNVQSSSDAAAALAPLAGPYTQILFAIGIVGLGLLSVPVLAGSAAYAVAETMRWHEGLGERFQNAQRFYMVIVVATAVGLLINFVGINPFQALVITAVINGVVAAPLLFLIARVAERRDIMGSHASGWLSRGLVWVAFAGMATAAIAMLVTLTTANGR